MANLQKASRFSPSQPINLPKRFLNKLHSGKDCKTLPKLPLNKKARDLELDGRIYRQLTHFPLVDNAIPIVIGAIKKPSISSKLRKVESAKLPSPPPNLQTCVVAITFFTEDISVYECERDSPRKKCKFEQALPKTIWGSNPTNCCYDCSSFAGFTGVTCIANDDDCDDYDVSDVSDDDCNDLDLDHDHNGDVFIDDYTVEDNVVPNSYLFGSPATLRELLKTYNKSRRI